MRTRIQISAGILSLVLLLTYNFIHTGQMFAEYVNIHAIGYMAAAGIELSIVALAIQIGRRKTNKQDATFFYIVLVAVVSVSALANASQGFLTKYLSPATSRTILTIDWLQGFIDLCATALVSFIVLALSEILGQDVTDAIIQAKESAEAAFTCQHCPERFVWPSDKYPTKRSAQNGLAGHIRAKHKPQLENLEKMPANRLSHRLARLFKVASE